MLDDPNTDPEVVLVEGAPNPNALGVSCVVVLLVEVLFDAGAPKLKENGDFCCVVLAAAAAGGAVADEVAADGANKKDDFGASPPAAILDCPNTEPDPDPVEDAEGADGVDPKPNADLGAPDAPEPTPAPAPLNTDPLEDAAG